MDNQSGEYVHFGRFEADLTTCRLFHNGEQLRLQQKPFQILELLLRNAGSLVTRQQIAEVVWQGVHVELDGSLNAAIRKLRTALGDNAQVPTVIETVGSRGYRFLLPVTFPRKQQVAASQCLRPLTLAVLPFRNLNEGTEDYFCDGLTEQMIARLGCVCADLSVIAPASAMRYRDTSSALSQIGRDLNSDYLLCGTVLRAGDRVRINARVIGAENQVCVWANSYTRSETDILELQDEISSQIAQAVLHTLPVTPGRTHNLTIPPAQYEKYLTARFFAGKAREPDFAKAARLFEQVVADNPTFGPAFSSLAALLAESGQYAVCLPRVTYDRVHALTSRAVALSDQTAELYVALGFESLFYHADFVAAEGHLSRALKLNPSFAFGYQSYGILMGSLGRHEESLAAMRRSRALDPFSGMANALIAAQLTFAGRPQEALEQARHAVEIDPGFPTAHACVGWSQQAMGHHDEAIEAYRGAVRCCPQSGLMLAHLAHGLATAGRRQEALEILQQTLAIRSAVWMSPYWIALVHVALGELDVALHWLDVAVDERDGWRVFMRIDSRWQAISSHPRFNEILAAIFPAQRSAAASVS
jgi:TolB-like protein/Tfp pilus assembly protein PilF